MNFSRYQNKVWILLILEIWLVAGMGYGIGRCNEFLQPRDQLALQQEELDSEEIFSEPEEGFFVEEMIQVLADTIGEVLSGYADKGTISGLVLEELTKRKLESEQEIRWAFMNRFNLGSPYYQKLFFEKWKEGVSPAIQFLSEGYTSSHPVNSAGGKKNIGSVDLSLGQLNEEFVKEVMPGIAGMRMLRRAAPSRRSGSALVQWKWFPQLRKWLPATYTLIKGSSSSHPISLNIVINEAGDKAEEIWVQATHKRLTQLRQKRKGKNFQIHSVVTERGHISLGGRKGSTGRPIGGIYGADRKIGSPVTATVGENGIIIELSIANDPLTDLLETLDLKFVVVKSSIGESQLIGSYRHINTDTITHLAGSYDNFWIEGLKISDVVKVNSDSTSRLHILERFVQETAQPKKTIFYRTYTFPSGYAHRKVSVLVSNIGSEKSVVPVFLWIHGESKKEDIPIFLKRIEVWGQNSSVRRILQSYYDQLYPQTLKKASALLKDDESLVITHLPLTKTIVSAAGFGIYLPTKFLKETSSALSCEVIFKKKETLEPSILRIGYYSPDDPLRFSEQQFHLIRSYSLHATNSLSGRYYSTDQILQDFSEDPKMKVWLSL